MRTSFDFASRVLQLANRDSSVWVDIRHVNSCRSVHLGSRKMLAIPMKCQTEWHNGLLIDAFFLLEVLKCVICCVFFSSPSSSFSFSLLISLILNECELCMCVSACVCLASMCVCVYGRAPSATDFYVVKKPLRD